MTNIAVVATYFLAAVAKLRFGGWLWANGATFTRAVLRRGTWFSDWTVSNPWLLRGGQWLMIVGELAAPVLLFIRNQRTLTIVVVALYGFHLMTFLSLGIVFLPHLVALAAFLPLERIGADPSARSQRADPRAQPGLAPNRPVTASSVGLVGLRPVHVGPGRDTRALEGVSRAGSRFVGGGPESLSEGHAAEAEERAEPPAPHHVGRQVDAVDDASNTDHERGQHRQPPIANGQGGHHDDRGRRGNGAVARDVPKPGPIAIAHDQVLDEGDGPLATDHPLDDARAPNHAAKPTRTAARASTRSRRKIRIAMATTSGEAIVPNCITGCRTVATTSGSSLRARNTRSSHPGGRSRRATSHDVTTAASAVITAARR